MTRRLLSFALLLPLWAMLAGAALAQNPTNGKIIYDNFCAGCHGANPGANKDRILNGKTSNGIYNAWSTYPNDMPFLNPPFFSDDEIEDIAAYIATKAPGGGSASFSANPTSHNYGSGTVGVQGAATTFTIANGGNASGTITSITNTNSTEFIVTGGTCNPPPKTVANGASCTLNIAFKPGATGARSATIAINNSGVISPVALTLTGTGGGGGPPPGQLSVPPSLNLGSQPLNVQSASSQLTITNTGGGAVTISSVTNSNPGEFPVVVNACNGTVAAGANCTISVAFKPVAAGGRTGTLTINSNGTGSPQNIALFGTGQATATPGQLSTPGSVNFGTQNVGAPTSQSVTLTNIGGSAVTISSVSSNNPSEFAVSGNSCAGSIGAGSSCGFTVTFTPAVAGARGATITVLSNGTGSPQSIVASGTGGAVTPPTGQKVAVIEYYHAAFNHYFVTAIPDEITKLDNGTFVGWQRTGKQFNVFVAPTALTSSVCRFFSVTFTPKSSHFYTPNVPECNGLKSSPDWQFEAEVFHMITSPLGTCPAGTIPVYRLYNQGEGGAPNHRYTTEPSTKALMIGQNWAPEGNGNDAVFMCSPL